MSDNPIFCKCCGIRLKKGTFPFGFFDNYIEFKEKDFIGNFYCIECANKKQEKHECEK